MVDTLTSSADAEAVVKSKPTLPLEHFHHNIKLSLPPVCFASFPERYRILGNFALVSKGWTSLA